MGVLILSRREGEVVEIHTPTETITVAVIEAKGKNVRLAFSAPAQILFLRQEISSYRETGVRAARARDGLDC